MELYLIRHTKPKIATGVCYGQADIDVDESFEAEWKSIVPHFPTHIHTIYSSPLQRCAKLAKALTQKPILYDDRLKELNCGNWELQPWDDIPKEQVQPWMDDFVNVQIPNGESYVHLHNRVVDFFKEWEALGLSAVVCTHAGVIRSMLSHINNVELINSFNAFGITYGCVVKIEKDINDNWAHSFLHSTQHPSEKHRPSYT
jgi:alpha-ribazole phosphatase